MSEEVWDSVRGVLLAESTVTEHVEALQKHKETYLQILKIMIDRKVHQGFSATTKGRILAACLSCNEIKMATYLLQHPTFLGLGEILRAVQMLDGPRQARLLEKKLARLELQKKNDRKAVRAKTLSSLRTKIHNLQQEWLATGTFSGSRAKLVRRWASSLTKDKLEFFLLHFPTDNWKALSDIIHLRKKDFQVNYFLDAIYGAPIPEDSLVHIARECKSEDLHRILVQHPQMNMNYSYLRKKFSTHRERKSADDEKISEITKMGFSRKQAVLAIQRHGKNNTEACIEYILERGQELENAEWGEEEESDFTLEAKVELAKQAPLEDLLWFFDELRCSQVENTIYQRLKAGEQIEGSARSSYGKLMERLLYFREQGVRFAPLLLPYAEKKLQEIDLPSTDATVAVLGDASGSMQVAIKCASTLGSLLSAALKADLLFFNTDAWAPSIVPRTAADAIKVVEETKAVGGTSMAAALWGYYETKKKVDLFVLVSDEGENDSSHGWLFAPLFKRYVTEVHPLAKVILVSFLEQGENGTIKERLEAEGITSQQFRLDKERPDTSKFDALLGLVTLETASILRRFTTIKELLQGVYGLPNTVLEIIHSY